MMGVRHLGSQRVKRAYLGTIPKVAGYFGEERYGVVAPPRPLVPPDPDYVRLDSLDDFATMFDFVRPVAPQTQANGRWSSDAGGTTNSSNTGPTPASAGPYVYFETSGPPYDSDTEILATAKRDSAKFLAWTGNGRRLHLRACLQGTPVAVGEGAGTPGLQIEVASDAQNQNPTWVGTYVLAYWSYADRAIGTEVVDGANRTLEIVQAGGWVDFDIPIPDHANGLRLRPRSFGGDNNRFSHQMDIALWQISLTPGT